MSTINGNVCVITKLYKKKKMFCVGNKKSRLYK